MHRKEIIKETLSCLLLTVYSA